MKSRIHRNVESKVVGLLGVGLDGADGHTRVTRAEDIVLIGGSEETHERMQETVIKVGEALERKGQRLRDTSAQELSDLIRDAHQ